MNPRKGKSGRKKSLMSKVVSYVLVWYMLLFSKEIVIRLIRKTLFMFM